MKAILVSAAFLIPALVLANDPSMKHGAMTPTGLLNKLHQTSQKGIEKGTVAQTNAGNEKVKSFGAKIVKDFTKLDKQVSELAKERNIVLATTTTYGAEESGAAGSRMGTGSEGQIGSDTSRTVPSEPGDTTGTAGTTPAPTTEKEQPQQRAGTEPMPSDEPTTGQAAKTGTDPMAYEKKGAQYQEEQAKWDRLKTLRGSEFDGEFLTMVSDGAQKNIDMLEASRIKDDKKLDRLIDRAVKVFKDHKSQADRLQRDVLRAS